MNRTRKPDELRPVKISMNYLKDPEGSCLIEVGNTKIICTASVTDKVPNFLMGTGEGWITAEYALLPRATPSRKVREGRGGKFDSRSVEISRMIGRSLRGVIDAKKLANYAIVVDCDVIQADGGTRTAAITGGFCALYEATRFMLRGDLVKEDPIKEFLAAVSLGMVNGEMLLDLSYEEDSQADFDLNIVMSESGKIIEIQGTGEKRPLKNEELTKLLELANKGIQELIKLEKQILR